MFDCIYNVFDSPLWGPGAAVRLKLTRLLMHDLPHPGFLFFPLIHFSWALPMGGAFPRSSLRSLLYLMKRVEDIPPPYISLWGGSFSSRFLCLVS